MENKPTGNVIFIFTDIEGSTRLSQEFPGTIQSAIEIHHKILAKVIESNNGFVFEIIGDGFCAAFQNADDAVNAGVEVQRSLSKEMWSDAKIKVRIGIHYGNAEWNGKNYMGYITLARTSRIMSAAYGEQIIISKDVYEKLSEKVFSKISFRDLGDRRLKDVIKPLKLFQVVAPGLREDFPPLKTLDARPNNLPIQLTSFIGREKELKQIKVLLSETHLLTLIGTGGAGKSRLSLQTGADVIDEFSGGVWFVELAYINDPMLLTQSVLSATGVLENPKETPDVTLKGYIKDKEILIILDNCEHMIDSCAVFAESLLESCPNLKILATSRESLKCFGEQIYRVPSLTQPAPGADVTPEKLTKYESVRLFIERALSVNTDFRVTKENASVLAEICTRLDGIPLAIELAAARTKILSVEKIYERLDDRFVLLTGGKRTALPRQQTLRALVDWSYDLLSECEKILWNRLTVFRGGWTLESAEEICSDELLNKYEILELHQNLSEKSIIIFDNANERYRMLETIRQYGDEKLKIAEEYKTFSQRHLTHFTELAEKAEQELEGSEIVTWLKILDVEKGNMENGLKYSCETGDVYTEVRMSGALGSYREIRGQFSEGIIRLKNILLKNPDIKNSDFNKIILLFGYFTFLKGEYEKAFKIINESYENYIELDDKTGAGKALNYLGFISMYKGEYDKAEKYMEDSLKVRRDIADKKGIASSLNGLGNVYCDIGELEKATGLLEESLMLGRDIGDKREIATSLTNLGIISFNKGEYDKGTGFLTESLDIRCEIGDRRGIAKSLNYLGDFYIEKEEFDKAIGFLEKSLEIGYEIGFKSGISYSLRNLGYVFNQKKEYDKAIGFIEKSLAIERESGNKTGMSTSLMNLGGIYSHKGDNERSIVYLEESLTIRRDIGNKLAIPETLLHLGIVNHSCGKFKKALEYFSESLSLFQELGNKKGMAISLLRLVEIHLELKTDIPLALILGFVKEYSDLNNFSFPQSEQSVFEESTLKLKKNLGDKEFLERFESGKSMTLDGTVDLVLNINLSKE